MKLGPFTIKKPLIVAGIEDEVLLGGDILQHDQGGPVDLMLSKDQMIFRGVEIPLTQIGVPVVCRKAYAADDYVVPAMSEAVIDVTVDRNTQTSDVVDDDARVLIEGDPMFVERNALLVAPCLCDIANNVTVKVKSHKPIRQRCSDRARYSHR